MKKIPKQEYTAEFRELAVKRVKAGQTAGAVAKELGLIEQTLRNWVKAFDAGKLNGPGTKQVTPEQMALPSACRESAAQTGERNPKKSGGVLCERSTVKYAWIDVHRDEFELAPMCDALTVSMSGYRSWKGGGSPTRTRLTDAQMLALIKAIHQELKGAYGSPRMVMELRDRGFPASKERVERLMRGKRHPGEAQATLQGHDGLQALAAGSAEPAGTGLHAGGTESGLDG